jgi:L-arabinonolactonase
MNETLTRSEVATPGVPTDVYAARVIDAPGMPRVRCVLGEGATWSAPRGELLWTDIQQRTLWAYAPRAKQIRHWALPGRLGCFALTAQPDILLAAFDHHLAWLDLATGETQRLVEFDLGLTTRANDGRCDRAGNFVFGTFDEKRDAAPAGSWYRYTPAGELQRLALPAVFIPNGLAFNQAGTRMYFCDSMEGVIRQADYNPDTGGLGPQHVFAQVNDGEPDGATVDADDHYWSAHWGAGAVQRYAPDGTPAGRVTSSARQPSCMAFGGDNLSTLFITSAQLGLDDSALAEQPDAGALFAAALPFQGVPEAVFGGVP